MVRVGKVDKQGQVRVDTALGRGRVGVCVFAGGLSFLQ